MVKHLAVIMDGNRRWAKKRLFKPWIGHRHGVDSVRRTVGFCLDKGIEYLSLYTFSLENFQRPEDEKHFLFDILAAEALKELPSFLKRGIRIRFIGDRDRFPSSILTTIERVERETAHLTTLNVNFLFCYGARQELVGGVKHLVKKIQRGELSAENITEQELEDALWTAGIPEPDLIIRTGGAQRLSNFLLYQAAYAEFCFLDCLWPDISEQHLTNAVDAFTDRQRNFGV